MSAVSSSPTWRTVRATVAAAGAFDLVLPIFRAAETTSWGPDRVARAWDVLRKRLRYTLYVSQGGDCRAGISDVMARQAPPGLRGIHVNRLDRSATIPPEDAKALNNGDPAPADLTAEEQGGAGLPPAHLLSPSGQGRSLLGLGTAAALL